MRVIEWRVYDCVGAQAVLILHEKPYSTVVYGDDEYTLPDGTKVMSGKQLPDDEWEELRQQVHRDAEEWARG